MAKYVQKNVPGANAQRALGIVALLGLFACGLMVGFGCSRNNQNLQEMLFILKM